MEITRKTTTETTITLQIRWFSVLADRRGKRSENIAAPADSTVNDIIDKLIPGFPEIKAFRPFLRAAMNQEYVPLDTQLNDGDELAFITPVSGG